MTTHHKQHKTLTGTVIGIAGAKTLTVRVATYRAHSLYQKRYLVTKKYLVHDEQSRCHVGQKVKIQLTRPLSKRKHFRVLLPREEQA